VPPTLTYQEAVVAFEGRRALGAWLELAECLERRGGWRFRISTDGLMVLWVYPGRRIWACAERLRGRQPQFTVFRSRGEKAMWWNCSTAGALDFLLDRLEQGRRPVLDPSGRSHIEAVEDVAH
jgi:hypothetical protein